MPRWTLETRACQARAIRRWQPWKTAGVKTPEGKARSRMNAYKHGAYSAESKAMRRTLAECRQRLRYCKLIRTWAATPEIPHLRRRSGSDALEPAYHPDNPWSEDGGG